jgi:hypothetical protein
MAFIALGLAAFWPALAKISTNAFGTQGDFIEFVWYAGWVPHALIHGLNPFWTDALNVPVGVNLGQNTEAPFLGFITAPLVLIFSPLVAANLLLVLAMPASATAAFLVLRKWDVWLPAAAIGGLLYGFSPYMIGQTLNHPQLSFVPLPPLIAYFLVRAFKPGDQGVRTGIWLGLMVSFQYLISPEVLATVAIMAILGLVCVALRHPTNLLALFRAAALASGTALVVTVILLAYPIWMLTAGPQHISGSTYPLVNPFHNDLLSFVVPGPLQRFSLGLSGIDAHIFGALYSTESGGYIGIPLLLLGAALTWRSRRSPRTQLALVLLLIAALLSLGPFLTVYGTTTTIGLPFNTIGRLPLINDILPSRLSFEVAAFFGALIAFGLDDLHGRQLAGAGIARSPKRRTSPALVTAGLIVLATAVITQFPTWPYGTIPSVPYPKALVPIIPAGDPITMTYPYDTAQVIEPMFWQATSGYRFRIFGGYVYIRGSNGQGTLLPGPMDPPSLQEFLAAQEGVSYLGPPLRVTPALVYSTRQTIDEYHVRQVIVDRSLGGSQAVITLFTDALGPSTASSGNLTVWASWPGSPSS